MSDGASPPPPVRRDGGERRTLVECHDCGLRYRLGPLEAQTTARCVRCGALLRARTSRDACLALALTGLVLIVVANFMPFMSLRLEGREEDASLATGAMTLAHDGLWPLTILILLLTIVMPALKLGAMAHVLGALKLRRPPRHLVPVLRWLDELHPWAMVEVYMLGLFVAYVKLTALATVSLGVAVSALAALMVTMAALDALVDFDDLWEELEHKGLVSPRPPISPGEALARCAVCNLLSPWHGGPAHCPRCNARLHFRKHDSVARSWALILAAAILYVPANLFPMLTVISFGTGAPDTILSGVKHLLEAGMWPLAILVFFASITVPVLKITGLALLLVSTQRGTRRYLRDRTRLYRVIEAIGRWSMIDIFMLSILVALVQLGAVATVVPGIGAISFAAVVVLTMFAAMAFDPRLMWDRAGENR
jgi:paraquat-inducible protein A